MGVFRRMLMNSKQRWMGGVVLLGGGVLLAALLLKGKEEIHQNNIRTSDLVEQVQQQKKNPQPEAEPVVQLQPLTVDVATEQRLLAEQRRAREKAVAEQEARAAEFLAMQQQAEAEAARKAAEEYAALNAHRSNQQSSDNIPPELVEDEKAKQKRLAEEKKAQAEQKIAEQKKAEEKRKVDEAKKADEKRKLEAEQKAAEKKKAEAEEKRQAEAEKKAAEKKQDEQKKTEAKKEGKPNGQWMVQVALAANPDNADAIAAKLRAQGYKVTKSPTSKGVRIMVGPTKSREAADDLRKKVNTDPALNTKSAWVIDWVPLDKR
jgi:colicin import membrane protein